MKTFFLYKIPLCLFGKVIKLLAFAHPSYCHLIGSKRRGVGGSLSQHAPQVTWPGESLLGRSPRTVTRGRYASYWNAFLFITGRNEVVAKVIFLHLFVILFTGAGGGGGGIPEGTEADTPLEQTPPREADSGIRSTSGRYASYWNAFLYFFQNAWTNLFSSPSPAPGPSQNMANGTPPKFGTKVCPRALSAKNNWWCRSTNSFYT